MPVNLSARAFLWIGLALILASALLQVALDLLFRYVGPDTIPSVMDSWWYSVLLPARAVFGPLGPLMLAAFFVARLIERTPGAPASPAPRDTSAWVFTAGVVLTLLGVLIVGSLDGWLTTLNAQGRSSLALDALNVVVVPLRYTVLPLGLALLPTSALMKKLEVRRPVDALVPTPTE
jgi:hypothetical protein